MQPKTNDPEHLSLGDYLREMRMKKGLDLEAVAEGTRISPKNLRAIEEGNFAALPAEVFTRGFYTLYAKCLALDPGEILEMYKKERKNLPKDSHATPPPNRLAENLKNLADPPSSSPLTYIGFILLLLLLFGAFLCWYFSWNPASYLSSKLRGLNDTQQAENTTQPPKTHQSVFSLAQARNSTPSQVNLLHIPSPAMATAATPLSGEQPDAGGVPVTTKYHVNAVFQEKTTVSLSIDNTPHRTMTFENGEQVSWRAVEKLIITLPGKSRAKISLNQIPLELPTSSEETITLKIPDYVLR